MDTSIRLGVSFRGEGKIGGVWSTMGDGGGGQLL